MGDRHRTARNAAWREFGRRHYRVYVYGPPVLVVAAILAGISAVRWIAENTPPRALVAAGVLGFMLLVTGLAAVGRRRR